MMNRCDGTKLGVKSSASERQMKFQKENFTGEQRNLINVNTV